MNSIFLQKNDMLYDYVLLLIFTFPVGSLHLYTISGYKGWLFSPCSPTFRFLIHISFLLLLLLKLGKWYRPLLLTVFFILFCYYMLFLAVQWGYLRFLIVVFPDHTHLLFLMNNLAPMIICPGCAVHRKLN